MSTHAQWGRGSKRPPWLRWWALVRWRTAPSWTTPSSQQWESPGCCLRMCGSSTDPWWVHVCGKVRRVTNTHQSAFKDILLCLTEFAPLNRHWCVLILLNCSSEHGNYMFLLIITLLLPWLLFLYHCQWWAPGQVTFDLNGSLPG